MSNTLEHMSIIQDLLFSSNNQKILKYMAENPSGEYTEREIKEATLVSRAGVNFALRALAESGLVEQQKRGKISFYKITLENPLIRQIKVLINLLKVEPLVESMKGLADKIILFGSSATGLNIEESDIDLFVMTNRPKEAQGICNNDSIAEKIQLVTKNPIEFMELKKRDPVFFDEVSRGLVLWEKKE